MGSFVVPEYHPVLQGIQLVLPENQIQDQFYLSLNILL